VVKGVGFSDLRDAGDPVERARHYDASGADEIVILDITASADARETTYDMVRRTADQVFIPLTVGGGVRSVGDVDLLLRAGADKISVGTAAVLRPELVGEVADRFGSQVLVVSVDARRSADTPSGFEVTTHGGRRSTGLDALDWVEEAAARGAGEVLLNSMDADGSGAGFDTELIAAAREVTTVPLVASGGAGAAGHFPPAAAAGADAVLAAGIFHRGEVGITEVKAALAAAGHRVRPPSTAAR
jgi:cyclase